MATDDSAVLDTYRQALALAGETVSVIAEWFLANAGDERLESLITPEFKQSIVRLAEVADAIEEAFGAESPQIADDPDPVHTMFGLSYASWLVLPRTLLQSMPAKWQQRLVALIEEYDHQWSDLPDDFLPRGFRVQPTESGKLVSWDRFRVPHYSRGRARVAPDGTISDERLPPC